MGLFKPSYFGNTAEEWFLAIAITGILMFAMELEHRLVIRRPSKLGRGAHVNANDVVVEVLRRTQSVFLLAIALYLGTRPLHLSVSANRVLETIFVISFCGQIGMWADAALAFLLERALKRKIEEDATGASTLLALGYLAKIALWSCVTLLALSNAGVDITTFVAGLGIGGIAVALATQRVLGDLFASLSIVLDKPFVLGDFIIVDDHMGTVEHVGLKTTRIRSLSGEQIVISNSDLLGSRIHNYKRMYERRVQFSIGVAYETPYEKLAAISGMLREAVESQPQTKFDRAHFKQYSESSLDFETVYYVLSPDQNTFMDIQQAINLELYRRFEQEGIVFAHPVRNLYIHGESAQNDQRGPRGNEGWIRGQKQMVSH